MSTLTKSAGIAAIIATALMPVAATAKGNGNGNGKAKGHAKQVMKHKGGPKVKGPKRQIEVRREEPRPERREEMVIRSRDGEDVIERRDTTRVVRQTRDNDGGLDLGDVVTAAALASAGAMLANGTGLDIGNLNYLFGDDVLYDNDGRAYVVDTRRDDRVYIDERYIYQASDETRFCPPGLAKKTPACVPPGQANKGFPYHVGDRIDTVDLDRYVIVQDPGRYGLDPYGTYYRADDYVVQVDRESRELMALVGLATAILGG